MSLAGREIVLGVTGGVAAYKAAVLASLLVQRGAGVTAVLTPLEPGFCHVTLSASVRKSRSGYVAGGAVIGGVGVVMSAGLAMLPGGRAPAARW